MGAGIIIVNSEKQILSLITRGGLYDLPKGKAELNESPFETAQRECFEECNVLISISDLLYETYLNRNDTQIFIAQYPTDQEIKIKPNPQTQKKEHIGWAWISIDECMTNTKSFLLPHLKWAKKKLSS